MVSQQALNRLKWEAAEARRTLRPGWENYQEVLDRIERDDKRAGSEKVVTAIDPGSPEGDRSMTIYSGGHVAGKSSGAETARGATSAELMEAKKWRTCVQVFEQENAKLRARLIAYEDAARAAAPKQPHPHEALHRALGVSDNGGHAPQTHNQVFWERLL